MPAKALFAVLLASASACGASSATSVPVKGNDPDVALLAGKWLGDYEGIDSGRRGSITFDLALGYHTAEGQVIMHPGGESAGVPLQIKFVSIGSGQISGRIAPYTDPACSCTVETEFTGRVEGSSMNGGFVTRVPGQREQTGRWSAQRTAP
jgi:hypothetical protein